VENTIYEGLIGKSKSQDTILNTPFENIDIIPSHINLVGAEVEMVQMDNREKRLRELLLPLKEIYDYILIDCSPSLGIITVNALTAADSVMIPVQCEYFALEGLSKLLNTIKIIKSKLNKSLEIEGFVLTMYDSRLRLHNQIYEEVKHHFKELVFTTVIQRNITLSESQSFAQPALMYDAGSRGAINYLQLAQELIGKNA
jgi:chromosome partitioning protein